MQTVGGCRTFDGGGRVAQLTENDIQLIYFQFSEIMSAIKMLVVRRGRRWV